MITKRNIKLFTKSNLNPSKIDIAESSFNLDDERQNMELLDECRRMYDSLAEYRQERRRNIKYMFGQQLDDRIPNPNGTGTITEKEYIAQQGNVPLSTNVIRKIVKSMVGVYRSSKTEPYVISRDKDEQKLGEMMTIAMQYEYQRLMLGQRNARSYEDFIASGLVGFKSGYGWNDQQQLYDIRIEALDTNKIFFDNNISGLYMENLKTIGYLYDWDLDDVIAEFAHSEKEKQQIEQWYAHCKQIYINYSDTFDGSSNYSQNFFISQYSNKCRVIEVWRQESEDRLRCHDILKGEWYVVSANEKSFIDTENAKRITELINYGGVAEDAALIEYEYFKARFWVCRWFTPDGHILKEMESPYWHNSHPFTIGGYPLIDGEIHSVVSDVIPTQRSINRLIQRIEFIRMASAKGCLFIPEEILEGKDLDKIAQQWAKPNGVISLRLKDASFMPKQLATNVQTVGDMEMLQVQLKLLDDISGISGALRGEKANSGTPSSLYAQETQNASNNLLDIQEWYNGFIMQRDYKIMMLVQQYFTESRYINVAGKDYSNESKYYDAPKVRNSHLDLSMVEGTATSAARTLNENLLMELLKIGGIDTELYLESSGAPFSEKLLERIKSKKEELQKQKQELINKGQQPNKLIEQALSENGN